MQDYLTVPKTILKTEEHFHIYHQQLPQKKTEYSLGNSAETIKTRGKKETICTHLPMQPTNTANTVIRGQKDLKLGCKKCSGLYSILSEKVQRTRQKLSTRAQYIGFSVVGK